MQKIASILAHSDDDSVRRLFELPKLTDEERLEMRKRAEEFDRAEKAREYAERIAKARIPVRYSRASLRDSDPAVVSYVKRIERGEREWLLLTGKNGRGKTYQACAALRYLAQFHRVEFSSTQRILDECQHTFGRPESMLEVGDHFRNIPVLVIDDFGKDDPTDWSLPLIFRVIDGRYSAMRPTIITTNMTADQMLAHMSRKGDRTMAKSVVSRLMESTIVQIEGEDRRLARENKC